MLLEGVRVVDLTDIKGAMCGRMLADLGADVVRPGGAPPESIADAYRNANKRRIPDTGLGELLPLADIVIDNGGGDLDLAPYPHLIRVAIADFGLSGPRSSWRLEPLTAQAVGGPLFASGFPDLAPCWFPGFLGPDMAAVYGYVGAIGALIDRDRQGGHGQGQTIEVSVQEACLAGTTPWSVAINDYLKINPFLPAEGKRNADGFYFVLPAADGWVRFVIGNDKQWLGTMALAGHPEVMMTEEWMDPLYRRMNQDVARLVLSETLRDRTRAQLFEEAREVGATMGVIHRPSEYVTHEQPSSRRVFSAGALAGAEGGPTVRPPTEFSLTPGRPSAAPESEAGCAGWSPRAGSTPSYDGMLPFAGLRVVEFGMAAVGPEAAGILAEFGADVIKIESSAHLDVLRFGAGARVNCSFAFNAECRGRRSITLNLDTGRGRELAFQLCAGADVIVENYRGGVLDGMGLGYDDVSAANPSVVYASSQGYGRTGPLGHMAAYGPLNHCFTGLHLLWNHADAPYPCGTSLNHPDHIAGKFLAGAIMAAVAHRARTGEGQRIDLAQTEFAAFMRGEVYLEGWMMGADPVAMGNDSPEACPHGVYPAEGDDRWVAIVCTDDADWVRLCAVAGWDDGHLSTADRLADKAAIEARLADWTACRPGTETATMLQAQGVSAAPVMGPLDQLADEHLAARNFFVELQHPEVGSERHAGNPIRMSVTHPTVLTSAPCLGADTAEILTEVLGMDPAEIEELTAGGVLS
jgi:crotonobetainyl-CoA:carnitine CoA-transferase CaiB-like acyl-CoA transferase